MLKLVSPSIKYKKSFLETVKEFQKNDPSGHQGVNSDNETINESNFDDYVKRLQDFSKGLNLPVNYVPATEYWLIDNDEYIGRISIRHYLNENLKKIGGHVGYAVRPGKRNMGYGSKMISLGLLKVKELGIKNVLVTCDKDNIGSVKIIEKNGGVLENEIPQGKGQSPKLRYWIEIK